MLDLHIPGAIGGIPLDAFAYRDIMLWVQSLISEGAAPKTIHNVHGLLSAAMTTAEMLGYIPRNRCRGVRLPTIEHVEDNTRFLTHAEFCLVLNGMDDQYNSFISFLVMTGTRFGEATAITVADVDLISRPPTARINKAWKRDGHSQYYLGATKTGAGKRTIGLRPALVELLIPLVAGRAGTDLLFTTHAGNRIAEKPFWEHYWRPAVHVAHTQGLTKSPRIHDLRHTHASWLIQDGKVSMFTNPRRLGHASTRTTENTCGHLMPQALQDGADAIERPVNGFLCRQ
jgi:integrase